MSDFAKFNETFCTFDKNQSPETGKKFFREFFSGNFEKVPRRNFATKIKNNFYFTVFSPFDMVVTCPNSEFSIRLTKSSKILNNTECILRSLFFDFKPQENTKEYMILSSGLMTNSEEIWNYDEHMDPAQAKTIYILY